MSCPDHKVAAVRGWACSQGPHKECDSVAVVGCNKCYAGYCSRHKPRAGAAGCRIDGRKCPRHHFVHGKEAEELRLGLEKLLAEEGGIITDTDVIRLLERVDARDSLAYLEARK